MGQRRTAGSPRGEQGLIGLIAGQYRPDGETFAACHNGKHDSFSRRGGSNSWVQVVEGRRVLAGGTSLCGTTVCIYNQVKVGNI